MIIFFPLYYSHFLRLNTSSLIYWLIDLHPASAAFSLNFFTSSSVTQRRITDVRTSFGFSFLVLAIFTVLHLIFFRFSLIQMFVDVCEFINCNDIMLILHPQNKFSIAGTSDMTYDSHFKSLMIIGLYFLA